MEANYFLVSILQVEGPVSPAPKVFTDKTTVIIKRIKILIKKIFLRSNEIEIARKTLELKIWMRDGMAANGTQRCTRILNSKRATYSRYCRPVGSYTSRRGKGKWNDSNLRLKILN